MELELEATQFRTLRHECERTRVESAQNEKKPGGGAARREKFSFVENNGRLGDRGRI